MATNQTPQSPREKRYGFAAQSVFGTLIADSAAFVEVDCEPSEIDRDIKEQEINGAHGSRQQNVNDIIVHGNDAMPKFDWEMFIKKNELADFLAASMQNVVEGALTPFDKTFTLLTTQPDYQANAGHFYTLIERDPAASKSTKMGDAILNSITFSLSGAEPLKATLNWIGKAVPSVVANPTGTWTRTTVNDLFYRSFVKVCTINFGAGAVNFHLSSLEITIANEITGVGQDGAGGFNTYMVGNPTHTFKIGVVKDADWSTAMANHAAGTPIDIRIGWGNATPGTADGDLDFAIHGKIDGQGGAAKEHNDPMVGVLTGKILKDGATEGLTVVMADAQDKAW